MPAAAIVCPRPAATRPVECHCEHCRPAPLTTNQIALRMLAGLGAGQLLVIAVDHLIGGPGAFALFGL
ncbi:MAG: hypothetical protein EOO66_32630 [Methylobacterium sp.]|nr:MAG: hypothetical protein EOO66_32630 [Methylobacterium sp.]